jgi:copper transport protein
MRCPVSLRHLLPVLLLAGAPLPTIAASVPAPVPHLALKRSTPTDRDRLPASPARISLWFTARPELAFSRISLSGVNGSIVLDTIVADTGNALHATIPRPLTAGDYQVAWRTASADGHPIRGTFTFTVLGPSPDTAAARAETRPRDSPDPHAEHRAARSQEHTDYRSARWVEFVALITVLGALGFRHGVLPPLAARGVPTADAADRARALGQGALFLYALAAIVRLFTESVALHGRAQALAPDALLPLLGRTSWGMGWMTGIVGALLLSAGWAISKRGVTMGTPLALTGALGLVASPALTGHAASSSWFIAAVTLDMLHVLAAGVWIGGLLMVLLAGVPAMKRLADGNPDAAVSALVNSFHPIALFCAPIVVVAGLGTSMLRLGGLAPLTTTRYGVTLLVKVGIFLVVAAIALYNSTRARRQLGTPDATSHLRRTAALELLLAALVIAATAFLVTAPAPSLMTQP